MQFQSNLNNFYNYNLHFFPLTFTFKLCIAWITLIPLIAPLIINIIIKPKQKAFIYLSYFILENLFFIKIRRLWHSNFNPTLEWYDSCNPSKKNSKMLINFLSKGWEINSITLPVQVQQIIVTLKLTIHSFHYFNPNFLYQQINNQFSLSIIK